MGVELLHLSVITGVMTGDQLINPTWSLIRVKLGFLCIQCFHGNTGALRNIEEKAVLEMLAALFCFSFNMHQYALICPRHLSPNHPSHHESAISCNVQCTAHLCRTVYKWFKGQILFHEAPIYAGQCRNCNARCLFHMYMGEQNS